MSGIVLKDIYQSFGQKKVLTGIDMVIERGQIFGLLGPSGCGKTTVIKIMGGILEATKGEAWVLGQRMPQLAMMAQIGYMAQSDALYGTLSAEENLQFWGAIYGLKGKQLVERSQAVLEMVGLQKDIKRPVQAFSGGMKRRLSLAIALLHQPDVLLLDEPTVGIDPLLRRKIWQALRDLTKEGVTIMLTTHVMDEAEKCDGLALMRSGHIIAQGTPAMLKADVGVASIEEAFIVYGGGEDAD